MLGNIAIIFRCQICIESICDIFRSRLESINFFLFRIDYFFIIIFFVLNICYLLRVHVWGGERKRERKGQEFRQLYNFTCLFFLSFSTYTDLTEGTLSLSLSLSLSVSLFYVLSPYVYLPFPLNVPMIHHFTLLLFPLSVAVILYFMRLSFPVYALIIHSLRICYSHLTRLLFPTLHAHYSHFLRLLVFIYMLIIFHFTRLLFSPYAPTVPILCSYYSHFTSLLFPLYVPFISTLCV
ncbi:unnamed protein product [Acanthosepion pharaonis]|uniref:Uncharacterized protein n=1 Tax=Acanthosepion pharaonis TaxID=158019 RepID=A0A812CQ96_ACAPH|nr:unnamed protein product [Sepia pharaonis]